MDIIFNDAEQKMKKAIEVLVKEFAVIRSGRASPAILEKVKVNAYGSEMPLDQLATINAPEPRMLLVKPFDKSVLPAIEKAILKADLGLNPVNSGEALRINFPPLNQERREELIKICKKESENTKVTVRNIRHKAKEEIEKMEKDKKISQDDKKRFLDKLQKLTDKYVEEVDKVLEKKEKEIREV